LPIQIWFTAAAAVKICFAIASIKFMPAKALPPQAPPQFRNRIGFLSTLIFEPRRGRKVSQKAGKSQIARGKNNVRPLLLPFAI